MNDRELLEMFIRDIDSLKLKLDEGDVDVFGFYEEVIYLKDFIEEQLNNMDEEMNIKGLLPWDKIDNIVNDEED
jgi:hypothetical protein